MFFFTSDSITVAEERACMLCSKTYIINQSAFVKNFCGQDNADLK